MHKCLGFSLNTQKRSILNGGVGVLQRRDILQRHTHITNLNVFKRVANRSCQHARPVVKRTRPGPARPSSAFARRSCADCSDWMPQTFGYDGTGRAAPWAHAP